MRPPGLETGPGGLWEITKKASARGRTAGTIKSHVHNLVKKTGTESREDLIVDFWQS